MKVYADNIPAEDRVGIGVVRIGDAAVAYRTNWLADPLDYATSDADRAEAWAFLPNRVLIADGEDRTAERGREDAEVSRDPSSPDRVNYGDPVCGKRDHGLRMTYALRLDQHDLILAEQDGLCDDAKWAQPFDDAHPPVVDHCHTIGEIFGLLRDACGALPFVSMGVCWLPAATTQPRGSGMWPPGRNSPKPPTAIGW